jgi:hypothetical protein
MLKIHQELRFFDQLRRRLHIRSRMNLKSNNVRSSSRSQSRSWMSESNERWEMFNMRVRRDVIPEIGHDATSRIQPIEEGLLFFHGRLRNDPAGIRSGMSDNYAILSE